MEKILDEISRQVMEAMKASGYDEKYGKVTLSNRPDLCEYQCNGAMAAAKEYKCAPFLIADKVAEQLQGNEMFQSAESVKPGFLNLKLDPEYLAGYLRQMAEDEERLGCRKCEHPKDRKSVV